MAYAKHEVLGMNKSGSTPKRGPKTIHKTTEPLAHTGPIYHRADHGDTSIARSGAPKKLADVAVHSGQHARTRDGSLITGQTIGKLGERAGRFRQVAARPDCRWLQGRQGCAAGIRPTLTHSSRRSRC